MRDRLKAASELSALDGTAVNPWHWKLDVTVYDTDGKNPKTGSLEMWFSDGNMRTVASLGSAEITTLRVGNNLYRSAGNEKDVAAISFIQMQVLHPVPAEVFQPETAVKLIRETAGKTKLDCIAPTLVRQTNDVISLGQQFCFCLEQDTSRLVVMYEVGGFTVLRRQTGMFQSHEVPVDLQTLFGTVVFAEAKTTRLTAESIDPSQFQVQPDMTPVTEPVEISSGDLSRLTLSQNAPTYPLDAKERHASGKVVFDAMIGKDGHVLSLQQTGQADSALAESAKKAVSQWLYRPYLINGIPVEVKATINVNFNFGN
ncbi:MAG: energy transducer TonB [Acidobacteriaceae bacterium]